MKKSTLISLRILCSILLLGALITIFLFSQQTGAVSGSLSGKITEKVLRIIYSDFDIKTQEEQTHLQSTFGIIIRKLAHVTEFFILAILCYLEQAVFQIKHPYTLTLVLGLLSAAIDEFHQMFVSGRGPQVRDVGIDFIGVFLGATILLIIFKSNQYKKEKKQNE